ncbi:conserved exported hypothetical protein [Paraburkholderia piptadeniae]|uniref:Secreted protein n=1 Tax=Paraburkholderia piptadeniae TaxID=1701573 RepID=A0A1N7S796_9BURK|nr:hypothetical protein [Paraburkholderia piptadeniae]SIT43171.1 conserved exported hypothetical protein [Paraburkholderia piptadeniae]
MKNLALVALAAVLVAPAASAQTIEDANAPSGAHFSTAQPACTVDQATLDVSCTGATIGGIGHTNANLNFSVTYTGTVQCTNHGGQVVDVKTQTTDAIPSTKLTASKNGQLTVPAVSVAAPTAQDLLADATCPNGNWTKQLVAGPKLANFVYTITFVGFSGPYFSISFVAP